MLYVRNKTAVVLMFVLALAGSAWGGIDEMQYLLAKHRDPVLRWYNVEGSPEWIGGAAPEYRPGRGLHLVRLNPGEQTLVKIPRREKLRIVPIENGRGPAPLEIWISNGSGLYMAPEIKRDPASDSLLVEPDSSNPSVARIRLGENASGPLEIAALVSRTEFPGRIAPYRKVVEFPWEPCKVSYGKEPEVWDYWRFSAGMTASVEIEGPARLKFECRLLYPPDEAARDRVFKVTASIGGDDARVAWFSTRPEMSRPVYIDGTPGVVGVPETEYIEIPEGRHTVAIAASADIIARMPLQEQNDFLFPGLNAPDPDPADIRERFPGNLAWPDIRDWPFDRLVGVADSPDVPPSILERLASRIARDNRRKEGGLSGAMLFYIGSLRNPGFPPLRESAEELLDDHAFYRDLLPANQYDDKAPAYRKFVSGRLRDAAGEAGTTVVAQRHAMALIDGIPGAWFANVSTAVGGNEIVLELPPRPAPTFLRVVADLSDSSTGRFEIQLDQGPPAAFEIAESLDLPSDAYLPSPGEIGMAAFKLSETGVPFSEALGGPALFSRDPAPLVKAATAEFLISPEVQKVGIRALPSPGSERPLYLAFQYRASKPFSLSESEYLELVSSLNSGSGNGLCDIFLDLWRRNTDLTSIFQDSPGDGWRDDALLRELENHWLPLFRLLNSRAGMFVDDVYPDDEPPTKNILMETEIRKLTALAEQFERKGDKLPALEIYEKLFRSANDRVRTEVFQKEIEALFGLGEPFLAIRKLKGAFLYGKNRQIRRMAFEMLEKRFADSGDTANLVGLYGIAAAGEREPAMLEALARVAYDEGRYEEALFVGLLAPDSENARGMLLHASLEKKWFDVFRGLLEGCDETEREFWLAHLLHRQARHEDALRHFGQAGEVGKDFYAALSKSMEIYRKLADPETIADPAAFSNAVSEWRSWCNSLPGPFHWEDAARLATRCAGTRTVYSIERDLYSKAFALEPDRPSIFEIVGPAVLKIEVRPVHPALSSPPVDGWASIRDGQREKRIAILQNSPSRGIRLLDGQGRAAGNAVEVTYEVGEGFHIVEVGAGPFDALATVDIRRPSLAAGALFPLTRETFEAAETGLFHPASPEPGDSESRASRSFLSAVEELMVLPQDPSVAPLVVPLEQAFWRQRRAAIPENDSRVPISDVFPGDVVAAENAMMDLSEAPEATSAFFSESAPEAVPEKMELLVRLATESPGEYPKWLAMGEYLYFRSRDGNVPGLAELYGRLTENSRWKILDYVGASAGIRFVPVSGWSPESPELRVRKALLSPLDPDSFVLHDETPLVAVLENTEPMTVRVVARAARVPYFSPEPMAVSWRLDDNPKQVLEFDSENPAREFAAKIDGARHVLEIALLKKAPNQFLALSVFESPSDAIVGASLSPLVNEEKQRSYHVATRNEPAVAEISGPAWVRIDERIDGFTVSDYRYFSEGWGKLELYPSEGRPEALFRIFVKAEKPKIRLSPLAVVAREPLRTPRPVDEPLSNLSFSDTGDEIRFKDYFSLGGQEDGTWSAGSRWRRRKNNQEEVSSLKKPEEFFELGAEHRYFSESLRSYFLSGALFRVRREGGPVLGLEEVFSHYPTGFPFDFRLSGELFLQRPDGWDEGDMEASLKASGTLFKRLDLGLKTYHVPSVNFFARWLSLDDAGDYEADELDQDVFTPYKRDHGTGVRISDYLTHRPWLDTMWRGGVSVASNEYFNLLDPDYVSAELEWRQLLGDFQLNAAYKGFHYFSDDDREESSFRDRVGLELVWSRWFGKLHLLEAGVAFQRELDTGENTGEVFVTGRFGSGRGFRDFRTGEIDFYDVRVREIPNDGNNETEYVRTR